MNHKKWYSPGLPVLLTSLLVVGCLGFVDTTTDDDEDGSSAHVVCGYSQSDNTSKYNNDEVDDGFESTFEWSCSDTRRILIANGIPNHDVGKFPSTANNNTISEQSVTLSMTLTPTKSSAATALAGVTGYMLNGIKVDAGALGSCGDDANEASDCSLVDNSDPWTIETLSQDTFDFGTDKNNGHVQSNGTYHYQGMPEDLLGSLKGSTGISMTLVGWASDGFPIYARYGYNTANDSNSGIKIMTSSYETVDESSALSTRPSIDDFPLGTFTQDWKYVESTSELDECNGLDGVTPEFPDGIYHYYATNTYPFLPRCLKGKL